MRYVKMFSCAAALGLLAFGASNVQASDGVLQRVTINMTLTSQSTGTTNGNVEKFTVKNTKFNTDDIMAALNEYYTNAFPPGAQLFLADGTNFAVYSGPPNKGGTLLQVIDTSIMSYSISESVVVKGNNNLSVHSYNGTAYYIVSIHLDNQHGTAIDVSGYDTESFNGNSTSGKYSRNENAQLSGSGVADGGPVVAKGNLHAQFNGTATP